MTEQQLLVELELEPDADVEEVERHGRQLRNELLQLDVEDVQPAPGPQAPEGAKAGGAVDWGSLLLTLSAAGGVFTSLITLARDWLGRNATVRRLKITDGQDTLVLDDATDHERELLITAWLRRYEGK